MRSKNKNGKSWFQHKHEQKQKEESFQAKKRAKDLKRDS